MDRALAKFLEKQLGKCFSQIWLHAQLGCFDLLQRLIASLYHSRLRSKALAYEGLRTVSTSRTMLVAVPICIRSRSAQQLQQCLSSHSQQLSLLQHLISHALALGPQLPCSSNSVRSCCTHAACNGSQSQPLALHK